MPAPRLGVVGLNLAPRIKFRGGNLLGRRYRAGLRAESISSRGRRWYFANRSLSVLTSLSTAPTSEQGAKRRTPNSIRRERLAAFRSKIRALSTTSNSSSDGDGKSDDRVDSILRSFNLHPDVLKVPEEEIDERTRWKLVPFATANHLALGSIFAWSVFNQPLMRVQGVLSPAAADWNLGDITITFSLVMGGFAWGALVGKYLDRFGPRASCLIGSTSLGVGYSLAALATQTGSLPMLYLGGTIWGLANGWAYVPPVSTLIKWFPDRKGFASGICLVGYGGGALIAAPLSSRRSLISLRKRPNIWDVQLMWLLKTEMASCTLRTHLGR